MLVRFHGKGQPSQLSWDGFNCLTRRLSSALVPAVAQRLASVARLSLGQCPGRLSSFPLPSP